MQRERRKWRVDIIGGNRRGKIEPRWLRQEILEIERILLPESERPTLQADDGCPLEYADDGYPKLPACLYRRRIILAKAA